MAESLCFICQKVHTPLGAFHSEPEFLPMGPGRRSSNRRNSFGSNYHIDDKVLHQEANEPEAPAVLTWTPKSILKRADFKSERSTPKSSRKVSFDPKGLPRR